MERTNISGWEDKSYLSVRDIQNILCISYGTASDIAKTLPRVIIGPRCKRIPTEVFKDWMKKNSKKGS